MNIKEYLSNNEQIIASHGCSKDIIGKYQTEMKVRFADDYIQYLETVGLAVVNDHELTGIGAIDRLDVNKVTKVEKKYNKVPESFYVIEETNVDGIVVWQNYDGLIYMTSPQGNYIKMYDNFLEYILS